MIKDEFGDLFLQALNRAADLAEGKLRGPIPRSFVIELHAPASSGARMSVSETLDKIYLGREKCYKIIDVAIKEILRGKVVAFVRVSGHAPVGYGETWDPSALGPFKDIIVEDLVV